MVVDVGFIDEFYKKFIVKNNIVIVGGNEIINL